MSPATDGGLSSAPAVRAVPRTASPSRIAVVGNGRMGRAIVAALRGAGVPVSGPHGRGFDGGAAVVVLLCVPDDQIAAAAGRLRPLAGGRVVGHCSGATGLAELGSADAFSVHPLTTVPAAPAPDPRTRFSGVAAAVAASSARAAAVADQLATALGLRTFTVADSDRVAYHAAAAMASNFLVTLQWAAARLIRTAGVDPAALLPLAHEALDNWAGLGPAALTGPVARGDQHTLRAHRQVIAERTPDLLPLFDALAGTSAELVRSESAQLTAGEVVSA